jgi:hypothetical protein
MSKTARRRIVPVSLGFAMLAVIVAAALVPNAGAIPASSSCQYNQCPHSSTTPAWEIASIGAIVVLGLLVGLFVLMRRRRPPANESVPASAATGGAGPGGPSGPSGPDLGAPAYVERPEDIGTPPPTLQTPAAPAAAAGGAAGAAAGSEAEPDIDSLMAELDKISGEILKRTPKKGPTSTPDEDTDDIPSN